jgi:hypothetical protein
MTVPFGHGTDTHGRQLAGPELAAVLKAYKVHKVLKVPEVKAYKVLRDFKVLVPKVLLVIKAYKVLRDFKVYKALKG